MKSKTYKTTKKKQRDPLIESGASKRGTGTHKDKRLKRIKDKIRKIIQEE